MHTAIPAPDSAYASCEAIVRAQDPDRYMLSMLAPTPTRPALWALAAFGYELAKTRSVVNDTRAGLIRLTWWRERLDDMANHTAMPDHPVAIALAHTITSYNLPSDLFYEWIYAREFDLEGVAPDTLMHTCNYARLTNAPYLSLAAMILKLDINEASINAIATAYGLCGILRAIPAFSRINFCLLPRDMLDTLPLAPEQFYMLRSTQSLQTVVSRMAMRAAQELQSAHHTHRFFKAHAQFVTLHLKRMHIYNYNVFNPRIAGPYPFMGLRLWLGI